MSLDHVVAQHAERTGSMECELFRRDTCDRHAVVGHRERAVPVACWCAVYDL